MKVKKEEEEVKEEEDEAVEKMMGLRFFISLHHPHALMFLLADTSDADGSRC